MAPALPRRGFFPHSFLITHLIHSLISYFISYFSSSLNHTVLILFGHLFPTYFLIFIFPFSHILIFSGGYLPLAATLATTETFDSFLGKKKWHALLHGHSFTVSTLQ